MVQASLQQAGCGVAICFDEKGLGLAGISKMFGVCKSSFALESGLHLEVHFLASFVCSGSHGAVAESLNAASNGLKR